MQKINNRKENSVQTADKILSNTLITDISNYSPLEIAEIYRKRWCVEVFIKFLKQNFGFAHLITLNPNGISTILWTTLIASILVRLIMYYNKLGARDTLRLLANGYMTLARGISSMTLKEQGVKIPWHEEHDIGFNLQLNRAQLISY